MTLAKLLQVVAESDSLTDKISINFMRMAAYLLCVVPSLYVEAMPYT